VVLEKHDADEMDPRYFTIDIRVLRPSTGESFSLAGEGHCNGGRFLMELPTFQFNNRS
jgi:hypothetical protein